MLNYDSVDNSCIFPSENWYILSFPILKRFFIWISLAKVVTVLNIHTQKER